MIFWLTHPPPPPNLITLLSNMKEELLDEYTMRAVSMSEGLLGKGQFIFLVINFEGGPEPPPPP